MPEDIALPFSIKATGWSKTKHTVCQMQHQMNLDLLLKFIIFASTVCSIVEQCAKSSTNTSKQTLSWIPFFVIKPSTVLRHSLSMPEIASQIARVPIFTDGEMR